MASIFGAFLLVFGLLLLALGYGNYYSSIMFYRSYTAPSYIGLYLGAILVVSGIAIIVFPTIARRLDDWRGERATA